MTPRSKSATEYEVLRQLTELGERFYMLVHAATGLPPELALRYALDRRSMGGSGDLKRRMQALAWLYEWSDRNSLAWLEDGLEERLRRGEFPDQLELRHAMVYADRGGLIEPNDNYRSGTLMVVPIRRRGAHTRRMVDWCDFLKWAANGSHWRTGRRRREESYEADRRTRIESDLEAFLHAARRAPQKYASRKGFLPWELEVLEELAVPDEAGEWLSIARDVGVPRPVWSPTTRQRNYLLFAVMRWLGLRRSEALKLKVEDLPVPLANEQGRTCWTQEGRVRVKRREDDPEDTRGLEPKVKRKDRLSPVAPTELLDDLQRYVAEPLPRGRAGARHGYLFVTKTGEPLSIAATDDIKKQLRAGALWLATKRKPDARHSLDSLKKFTWHRLRHTRAREVWRLYRAQEEERQRKGLAPEDWQQRFQDEFGWASLETAQPYLNDEHHAAGAQTLDGHHHHLRLHPSGER